MILGLYRLMKTEKLLQKFVLSNKVGRQLKTYAAHSQLTLLL